ncbi:hypothetical protein [uncultured Jatrophihabitans sp.]|uniref:NAD(P)H-dependent amine dehydrogenase family protein n=1 Tax=uncultured Jatrophihabitans sp. TaxID=1610747 RepID=UPI0035CB75C4
MNSARPRVIQWGTGGVGLHALEMILASRDLELVGVKCFTAAKDGVDAGALVGLGPVGVTVTSDAAAVLEIAADVVLYMPRDLFLDPTAHESPSAAWIDEVVRILESGKSVVSPLQSAMHWRQLADGHRLRQRLDAVCRSAEVSLFFTGLDPGFISDCLATALTSAAGRIEQVRTFEVIDYSTYQSADTLRAMGFGMPVDEETPDGAETLIPSWGCASWLVADALGVEIDDLVLAVEPFLSTTDFVSSGGLHVAVGTVAAMRWSLTAMVDGHARIVNSHVGRIGADLAPDWPQIGSKGGYRIEIDGSPPLLAELPLGLDGGTGTCLGDAVLMTAARCVNSISTVLDAAAGYHLLNELPSFGGRHALRPPT